MLSLPQLIRRINAFAVFLCIGVAFLGTTGTMAVAAEDMVMLDTASAAGWTRLHGRKLRSRPRNETNTNTTASSNIAMGKNGMDDATTDPSKSHNSSTTATSDSIQSNLNSSQGELLDGVLAVNKSHASSGLYYYAHSPEEFDTISATDGWINVSTTIHPDSYDIHNSNNNVHPVINNSMNNAIFPTWGQLFLYIVWSLTIIFCCIIPSIVWFRRKAHEEQETRNNFSMTHSSPALHATTSRRGLLVTHENNRNNNNTSSRSRLTLRQHLFINSPNWKKYVQAILSATWKKTKVTVCKEHYCCSNNDEGRDNDGASPTKALNLSNQCNHHKIIAATKRRSGTAATPGSPFRAVFATASRHAHARATKTITPPSTPSKDPSNNITPNRSPKKSYSKLGNNKEYSSTSSSSSRSIGSAATVITTSSRPSSISISNNSLDDDSINCLEDEEEDISSVKSKSALFLRIPATTNISVAGKKSRQRKKSRKVPNSCAICLDCYEIGDTVVWSSTDSSCVHAFHEHCIAAWCFRKIEEQFTARVSVPCPCCRQPFVDLHLDFDAAMNTSIGSSSSTTASNFQEAHQPARRREVTAISPAIAPVLPTTTSTRNPPPRRLEEEIAFEI